jgi:hypothetical protein
MGEAAPPFADALSHCTAPVQTARKHTARICTCLLKFAEASKHRDTYTHDVGERVKLRFERFHSGLGLYVCAFV